MSVPIGGGTPATIASGQQNAGGVAVDATGVYWANGGQGTVLRHEHGATTMPEVLISGQIKPYAVVLDASWVYFTSAYGGGTVQKIPK
jgi:hypothetical protein